MLLKANIENKASIKKNKKRPNVINSESDVMLSTVLAEK